MLLSTLNSYNILVMQTTLLGELRRGSYMLRDVRIFSRYIQVGACTEPLNEISVATYVILQLPISLCHPAGISECV